MPTKNPTRTRVYYLPGGGTMEEITKGKLLLTHGVATKKDGTWGVISGHTTLALATKAKLKWESSPWTTTLAEIIAIREIFH